MVPEHNLFVTSSFQNLCFDGHTPFLCSFPKFCNLKEFCFEVICYSIGASGDAIVVDLKTLYQSEKAGQRRRQSSSVCVHKMYSAGHVSAASNIDSILYFIMIFITNLIIFLYCYA